MIFDPVVAVIFDPTVAMIFDPAVVMIFEPFVTMIFDPAIAMIFEPAVINKFDLTVIKDIRTPHQDSLTPAEPMSSPSALTHFDPLGANASSTGKTARS
jgi:hypothetical protein